MRMSFSGVGRSEATSKHSFRDSLQVPLVALLSSGFPRANVKDVKVAWRKARGELVFPMGLVSKVGEAPSSKKKAARAQLLVPHAEKCPFVSHFVRFDCRNSRPSKKATSST